MRHLVARFFRSLRVSPPTPADKQWARGYLTDAEWVLFDASPTLDRAHGVAGGRIVAAARPEEHAAIEAALIHDVGKRHARLGVFGRSAATAIGWVIRSDEPRRRGTARGGWPARITTYLRHDELGAAEVAAAGGSALAVAWTRDHHHSDRYLAMGVSTELVEILAEADAAT